MKLTFKRISKSTLSVVLAIMMVISTMLIGTFTVSAVQNTTIYFTPTTVSKWTEGKFASSDATSANGYSFKIKAQLGGQGDGLKEYDTTDFTLLEGKLYNGNEVFQVTFNSKYDGVNNLQFQAYKDSTYYGYVQVFSSWTGYAEYNGKLWDGTNWISNPTFEDADIGVLAAAPENVLSGTDIMFYIGSYDGGNKNLGLTKNSTTEGEYVKGTFLATKSFDSNNYNIGYIQIAESILGDYYYITNNYGGWAGDSNEAVKKAKAGGLYAVKGSTTYSADPTTASTTLSERNGNTITLNTTASATTSSYGSDLYVQYYVDDKLVAMDSNLSASTTASSFDLDVSSYSVGNHELETVLTDGKVYYIADTDTLTIGSASHTITYATVDNVTAVPTAGSAAEGDPVTITGYTAAENYTITGYTVTKTGEDSTTVPVTQNGDTYSFKMPDYNVTVTPTVTLDKYTVTYNTAEGIETTPSSAQFGVGTTVTITGYTAAENYTITGYTVTKTGQDSTTVPVTQDGDTYSFTMPDYDVTVTPTVTSTTPTEISFALVDDGSGLIGASTYSDSTYKLNYNADTQEYTTTVEYSSTSKKNWFLIMDNSNNYYGTSSKNSELFEDNTSTNKFTLYKSTTNRTSGGAYPLYFNTQATYTIHVQKSGTDYVAWVSTGDDPTPENNYYIGGAFQIYDSSRTTRPNLGDWDLNSTSFKFTEVSTTLYQLETYSTISELAETYGKRTQPSYFLIHNGNGTYYEVSAKTEFNSYNSSTNTITLTSSTSADAENCMYFTADDTNTGYVTLYLDTSDGYKLYYTTSAASIKNVTIYAKDGTTNAAENATSGTSNGTAIFGETLVGTYGADGKFIASTSTDYNPDCRQYSVTVSEEEAKPVLTVQTTVDPTYYSNGDGYYVAGFVINGATYAAINKGNGVFETEYTVDGTVPKVEITPVYFSKAIEDAGDYMTFYFDASELPAKTWGEPITVGVYSYYYTGEIKDGKPTNEKMQDGSWPGQPMLKDASGTLWTKVSKKFYGSATKATEYGISGLVLNNYAPDTVHSKVTGLTLKQTYDYNDIIVASEAGYDTIRFEAKYRDKLYHKTTVETAGFKFSVDAFETGTGNGWDKFTFYDKTKTTDIFGNEVDSVDVSTSPENAVYIVSTGDQDTINTTKVGQWSTIWYVYNSNGALIAKGHPSQFIGITTSDLGALAEDYSALANYANVPTYITYEKENDNRSDGRWYYINSASTKATIKMGVQIQGENGNWVDGVNGTNGTATIGDDNATEKTYTLNETALINAIPPLNYVFDSWAIDYTGKGNYTPMDLDTPSGEIKVSNNATIVARFVPIASGDLVIAHSAYPGSALAYYYVSATLTKENNTTETYTNSTSPITFKNINPNDKTIAITLSTRPGGINEFEAFYQRFGDAYFPLVTKDDIGIEDDEYDITVGADGTVSYSFTVQVADLFTTDKTVQMISALSFYSNVSEKSADVTLKYIYDDRDNNPKTYIATDKLNDKYIEDHPDYSLNNEDGKVIIYKNAPYIQDLYKDCTWVITEQTATYSGTTVTLKAVQTVKTYTVTISDAHANGGVDVERPGIAYNSFLCSDSEISPANPKGLDVLAQGENFLYWKVTNSSKKEIARTTSQYFDLRIIEDCTITAVYEGQNNPTAYISEPTYTREQYTENGVKYDYVYADFNLAYSTPDGTLIRDNADKYKTGIIVELDKSATTDPNNNITSFGDTTQASLEKITKLEDGTRGYTTDDNKRIAYNYIIDNNTLFNNRNRLDYYLKYNNTAGNRKYIMRAYFYVIDPSGTITISAPVYFRFDGIGTTVVENPNNTETTA